MASSERQQRSHSNYDTNTQVWHERYSHAEWSTLDRNTQLCNDPGGGRADQRRGENRHRSQDGPGRGHELDVGTAQDAALGEGCEIHHQEADGQPQTCIEQHAGGISPGQDELLPLRWKARLERLENEFIRKSIQIN